MDALSRLRWRCRRGTRELDLLLESFLDAVYPGLTAAERAAFEGLIEASDPDLLDWIAGRTRAPTPEFDALLARLRRCRPGGPR